MGVRGSQGREGCGWPFAPALSGALGVWTINQAPQANLEHSHFADPWARLRGKTSKQQTQILVCNGGWNLCVSLFRYLPFPGVPSTAALRPQWLLAAALKVEMEVTSPERSSSSGSSQGHEEGRCLLTGS